MSTSRVRVIAASLLLACLVSTSARAFVVNVVDENGDPVSGFKWLLEEDTTHPPRPGVHAPISADVNENTLGVSIHRSHAPVIASGETADRADSSVEIPRNGRFFVSVLPFGSADLSYDLGGAPIDCPADPCAVTVYVKTLPIKTARISVKIFHDVAPLNNAPDTTEVYPQPGSGVETLGAGCSPADPRTCFTVTLMDQAGDITQDNFGNPLGTIYQRALSGNPCPAPNGSTPVGEACLDADGNPIVLVPGSGDLYIDANGELLIENLAPSKYGVQIEPPTVDAAGNPVEWLQTSTIEGTKTVDAWVRPNEPPFLVEFGPPFWHVFHGFVRVTPPLPATGGPVTTVMGEVRKGHLSRPPSITFFNGPPPEGEAIGERCVIGLNSLEAGFSRAVWVGKCDDETGTFAIPNVPPGTYQIVIFDVSLLHIISFNTVVAPDTGGVLDLGELPTPMWFGTQDHYVYNDRNKNGIRECVTPECNSAAAGDEVGIPEQNINIRFRDGTIYQSYPTDGVGFLPLQWLFPFFHWQVAEVDYARLQPTGVRIVVDDGGQPTGDADGEGRRNPQPQDPSEAAPDSANARLELGTGVVLEGFQQFAGQNTKFEWGKASWDSDVNSVVTSAGEAAYFASIAGWPAGPGDLDRCTAGALSPAVCPAPATGDRIYNNNGGISGIIFYATTRAEDDPRFAAGDGWEPGIPRVQVNLYRDVFCKSNGGPAVYPLCPEATPGEVGDGIPDDPDAVAGSAPEYADVDNYPLGWNDGSGPRGPEDLDRNGDGDFDQGDAIRVAYSDSWDDAPPEGCRGPASDVLQIHGAPVPFAQCAEGLRTWNQARPALFDGGYIFAPEDPELVPGTYIVEVATPPGYEVIKEEDRNVDFGPTAVPAILPPKCVGAPHLVPPLFSFLTDAAGNPLPGVDAGNPDNAAPYAGETRPLCDRKKVALGSGQNAAADFFLFTDVPRAGRGVGLITDDLANEIAPNKPAFTEKYSPPWMPIALFDYTGREIFRTYGDEFGAYNFLVPSTYHINAPIPAGVGEKMNQFCLNHPTLPDGTQDPYYKSQYSTTCYSFNFQPGKTTYLDTPVIRQAAFVGSLQQTLDCEDPDGTPQIRDVVNFQTEQPAVVTTNQTLVITSLGSSVQVPNPAYPGDANSDGIPDDPPSQPQFITRDFGFGAVEGQVVIGGYVFPAPSVEWSEAEIRATVPTGAGAAGLETGQLTVVRGDNGNRTLRGLTVTVGNPGGTVLRVPGDYETIQEAINAAPVPANNQAAPLILIDPGEYRELPIMNKRVRLQGAGAGSTILLADHYGAGPEFENSLTAWHEEVTARMADPDPLRRLGLLPGQNPNDFLFDGEGPGIFVAPPAGVFNFAGTRENLQRRARIDGLQIRLGDIGGAIYVNANANRLLISNNLITANGGNLAGGIRIGNSAVPLGPGNPAIGTSPNPQIDIRFNQIRENGSIKTGGGIAVYAGATGYRISSNQLCGNLARSGGGAIAHRGLSDDGTIERNVIVFNEVFQGDQPGAGLGIGGGGGGIELAGDPDPAGGLTAGTGSVLINANLIQGNLGGAADGGGIALRNVNGDDVAANPGTPADWHLVRVYNNMIVDNVSGMAGGGLSLQDTTRAQIIHNTIAHNDSTATGLFAFLAGIGADSTPLPAGVVSRAHSNGLAAVIENGTTYSVPAPLRRNIVYQNRSWFFQPAGAGSLAANPGDAFWDLGVVGTGTASCLNPTQGLTTGTDPRWTPAGGSGTCNYTAGSSLYGDPLFVSPYFNTLTAAAAADEGGNFVQVYYTPLGRTGDYHLGAGSPAIDAPPNSGAGGLLGSDFDGDPRPLGLRPDTGADERP
jgi:hypothetical protein